MQLATSVRRVGSSHAAGGNETAASSLSYESRASGENKVASPKCTLDDVMKKLGMLEKDIGAIMGTLVAQEPFDSTETQSTSGD